MKYSFSMTYELDCTVGEAVAAYLDIEHYAHLHRKHVMGYEIMGADGTTIAIRQFWKICGFKTGHDSVTEYVPPGRFLQYDFKPYPRWLPSIYSLVKPRTDLQYMADPTDMRTVSTLTIELTMPFWLWPLRHIIQKALEKLKMTKDQEDMDMIARRQMLFGRGNLAAYLAPHQFLLHKELFMQHFA